MSLPGLGLTESAPASTSSSTVQKLNEGSEWRFEVAFGSRVNVKLLTGTAEIFGTELAPAQTYTFTGTKAAIYTWYGCTLEISSEDGSAGGCQVEYTAEETPMVDYANVHFALETLRQAAKAQGRDGPRVLILGPENAGKTSLAKILTGYATRVGRQPVVVNLDSREGLLSIPGSLSATAFKTIIDVEEGWGNSPMSGPSPVPVKMPLVYFYGLPSPLDREGKVYKPVVSRLALAVTGRLAEDEDARETGVIVDTPGAISQGRGGGYEIIHHIVSEFSISTILVLGSERLYSDMLKRFDSKPTSSSSLDNTNETITVVKLTKSGGCVDRDPSYMTTLRQSQIRSYFFSNPSLNSSISLSPHNTIVDFSTLSIYRLLPSSTSASNALAEAALLDSFLPGGGEEDDDTSPTQFSSTNSLNNKRIFQKVTDPTPALANCILAVMNCDANATSDEEVRDSSVLGFLYVVEVDVAKGKVRVLLPVTGRVPMRALVWGGGWPEEVVGLVG